ncbi:MAG: GuaB3 family IMP dehydrogenase-related protein [Actinomycetota bacterium]|nr:GuaB3 family IMP dehydrogenase-related protein [Actinomycetota bacterium]
MNDSVEIGIGRTARRSFSLDEISIVPSRRTRSTSEVSTGWQIDAYRFEIPCLTQPSDAVVDPATAVAVGRLGGLGVLDGEGLWARHAQPQTVIDELVAAAEDAESPEQAVASIQRAYSSPVSVDLLTEAIGTLRDGGSTVAVRLSPQNAAALAPQLISAGVEVLVIQGTIVSAEHVRGNGEALNLKSFIADLDVPVIVGGCTNFQTATHLMRTGAAGVIVGTGAGIASTTDLVLGIEVPMATAIADAAAARRAYLDETGGRYVHVIAAGDLNSSADIAKAIACGADAVMLGELLAEADTAPAGGWYWPASTAHPALPRGLPLPTGSADVPLDQLLTGPAVGADGRTNLFGALRRAMAKTGYSDLKEFQKVGLSVAD